MSSFKTWNIIHIVRFFKYADSRYPNLKDALYSSIKRYKLKLRVAYAFYDTLRIKGRPSLSPSKKFIKKLDPVI